MIDRNKIEDIVREKLMAALSKKHSEAIVSHINPIENLATNSHNPGPTEIPLDFVNEEIVLARRNQKIIPITHKAVITPTAHDLAEQYGIQFLCTIPHTPASPILPFYGPQTIVIGADHGGYPLKEEIKKELKTWGYTVVDVGTNSSEAVDYPDFAYAVASAVASGQCKRGIMIDGAGIGSAMAANKVHGIRAAHCTNIFEVKNSREHNDANVLTLGAKVIGSGVAIEMVKVWLDTHFAGGRHQRRVEKIMQLEK